METGVSTIMDQLVGLLESKPTVKMGDAAKQLDVPKDRVESWAKMLEKEGVIQIHYSVIGGALLKKGQNFDDFQKKSAAKKAPLPLPKEVKPPPAKEAPSLTVQVSKTPRNYALIKKQIAEEEQTIEKELARLREEQAKIVESMTVLVAEGHKLTEYIEALRVAADQVSKTRGKKLAKVSASK
jgi:hypothetical protein